MMDGEESPEFSILDPNTEAWFPKEGEDDFHKP